MAYTFKHGDRPLEGYVIQRGIGRGGFGEVYYAISDGGREVALKFLRDNSEIELRGVSQCMNLKSPHLVTIFDVKKNDDGDYFIIMEHISGPSLAELLVAEPNGLGTQKAAFLLREIAKGLAYLHDRGIVHRDMKPANIFYEDGHVKIGDYGLSKFISLSRHSAQTTSVGTVHYMAPEVGGGNYHRGIDIYALGVIFYEMLCGRVPFEGSSMGEVLMKHLTEQPAVQDLPQPFGDIIRKALEKDPKDRYQTVHEMIDDLLEAGDVRSSLAGFNPATITAVPRSRGDQGAPSPVPSPNPQRVPPPPPPRREVGGPAYHGQQVRPDRLADLPPQVGQRISRISEKIERRMDKLAGRPRGAYRQRRQAAERHAHGAQRMHNIPRWQGRGVAALIALGISIGTGVVVGLATEEEALGASAGMMIVATGVGVGLAQTTSRRMWALTQPPWVRRLLQIGCFLPLAFIAALPATDVFGEHGFAVLLGALGILFFADWSERIENGARGELSFGRAFWLAIWGGIACAIAARICDVRDRDELFIYGAAVGGALSLLVEAASWFLQPLVAVTAGAPGTQPSPTASPDETDRDQAADDAAHDTDDSAHEYRARGGRRVLGGTGSSYVGGDIPDAIPLPPGTPTTGNAATRPPRRRRSGFARGAFGLLWFAMVCGMVINIVMPAVARVPRDELMGHATGAVACFAMLLFASQKLTTYKRLGFWRETVCPLLIAATQTGMGASIAAIAIYPMRDAELALAISGLICSSIAMIILLVSRFSGPRGTVVLGAFAAASDEDAPMRGEMHDFIAHYDRPRDAQVGVAAHDRPPGTAGNGGDAR